MASALIFIALAVAWAAYLIPQAVRHRNDVQRQRSVQRFSHRMRVLARREPTSARAARLVVTPGRAPSRPVIETKGAARRPLEVVAPVRPVSATARRAAAARAARRRRNVLAVIASSVVVVAGLAFGGLFSPWWTALPGGLLVAWLVACRLSVRRERTVCAAARTAVPVVDTPTAVMPVTLEVDDETGEVMVVDDDPSRWDMVPVTLPTYVTKPVAERSSVSTIDLDSSGVWTSGRTEVDAEIARQAEARRRAAHRIAEVTQHQRAVGS